MLSSHIKSSAYGLELSSVINNVHFKTLKNGLKVLYYPYTRADVTSVYLCVKVGSAYETEKEAGITHLIEHMIFKGTETRKPEEIAGLVEYYGGYMNAFTSFDYTCYYIVGPSDITPIALEILSDIVFHPYFDPEELKKEKEVVLEEMKMRLDNPTTVLFEEIQKNFYTKYPYKRPIIGYNHTVSSFTREDLLSFVKKFYSPSNMYLIIVGNVEENKVFSLVNKFFSNIPERTVPKIVFPEEPYISQSKFIWIKRDVKEGYFDIAFPAPSIKEEDAPLVDLLSVILGEGEASRLYLNVKRKKQLVNSVYTYAFTPIGPGMFLISGTTSPEKFKEALKEIFKEIEIIKNIPPSKEELERAKIQILSDFIYSQQTSEGLARTLGSFQLTRNNYKDILWYINKIKSATPEDISNVAKKYLDFNKCLVGFLSSKKPLEESEFEKIINSFTREKPSIYILENGLKVILVPEEDLPIVAMALVFPGGTRFENKDNNGLFQALSLLWTRGTSNYSAEEISQKLESLGAEIEGFSGRNTFGLKALCLSQNIEEVLNLFADIVKNPTFSEEECKKAKNELLSSLLKQEDHPISLAIKEFLKEMFPEHPYGLNKLGSKEFFLRFNSQDLKHAYEKFVVPSKGVLVIVGNIEEHYIKEKFTTLFKDFKDSPSAFTSEEETPNLPKERKKLIKKDVFQTQIILGFQTPGLNSEEKTALEVLNSALSGQEGLLFKLLREEKALAYSVTSLLIFYPKSSVFIFYIACSPEKTSEAIEGFWNILEELSKEGLSEKELTRAKNRLLGEIKISLQSNTSKAKTFAVNQVLGLGWNYYEKFENEVKKITQEDIKSIIKNYLTKERSFMLILGNQNGNKSSQ